VVLSVVLFVLDLVAGAVTGWAWTVDWSPHEVVARSVATLGGQGLLMVLFIASGFALPRRWLNAAFTRLLGWAVPGLLVLAVASGIAVGRAQLPAGASGQRPAVFGPTVLLMSAVGAVLLGTAVAVHFGGRRRAVVEKEIMRAGTHTVGQVTDTYQTGSVNDVPRWRVVVRFVDSAGTTRWVTKRIITWEPPRTGQRVQVYYDPTRPDARRLIFVRYE